MSTKISNDTLKVDGFLAGRMLLSPKWSEEIDFRKQFASVEPWMCDAVKNKGVNLFHSYLSRKRESVTDVNPVYFNGQRYNSWEALRSKKIPNYSEAKFLSWDTLASWEYGDVRHFKRLWHHVFILCSKTHISLRPAL